MKILFTSDLHIINSTMHQQLGIVRKKIKKEKPDVLVVSGDVSDDIYIKADDLLGFLDVPVVYCLGNHEFVRNEMGANTVENTLNFYKSKIGKNNAHCLDVEGHFDIGNVRFVGNVLWYDGTLSNRPDADANIRNISRHWLDSMIADFRPVEEHKKCVAQIVGNLKDIGDKKAVLVTHCVPHRELNWFDRNEPMSIYNAYSGVANFFDKNGVYPDVALCGHTHKEMKYVHVSPKGRETRCSNIGNDYFFWNKDILFEVIEV